MVSLLRMKRGEMPVEMEEEQTFLPNEEQAEEDIGTTSHWTKSQSRSTNPYMPLTVYSNIHL